MPERTATQRRPAVKGLGELLQEGPPARVGLGFREFLQHPQEASPLSRQERLQHVVVAAVEEAREVDD